MLSKYLYFTALLAITLFACKQDKSGSTPTAVEIPDDFVPFYKRFHDDSVYQKAHIIFPLEGLPSLKPGTDLSGTTYFWESVGWVVHKPYIETSDYSRTFDNFAGIITETIVDNSGTFDMVRRFSKMEGEWMLIFYKEMGPRLSQTK